MFNNLWLFCGLFILGLLSKNSTITITGLALILLQLPFLNEALPAVKRYGAICGITILTISMLTPLTDKHLDFMTFLKSSTEMKNILAIFVGAVIAFMGGKGFSMLQVQGEITNFIIIGSMLGVLLFRGVPIGPLIAAGFLYFLLKIFNLQ